VPKETMSLPADASETPLPHPEPETHSQADSGDSLLESTTTEHRLSPAELAFLVCTDLQRRWRRGERIGVEAYLECHPQLRLEAAACLQVIACELQVREAGGESPDLDDYCRRFPELAVVLRRHFALLQSGSPLDGGWQVIPSADPGPRLVPGYDILGELGRGGMGVVYRARQKSLNRIVALKMILNADLAGELERARFKAEAEAVARLQHPNIVQIFEVGAHEGRAYFSLEFCDGGSLKSYLAGKALPPAEAAALVATLARALHHAHGQGVIHRDLKPGNVLLSRRTSSLACPGAPPGQAGSLSYEPKVTDFGLAKRLDTEGHTHPGDVLGTPGYMAPEQAAGRTAEIGPATDVYSLGVLLYECLTGRPPFLAASSWDTLQQVIHAEPLPPRQLQPRCPRDLETICLKCLAKTPARRYPTAAALADDLQRFLDGRPVQARRVGAAERLFKWARRRPAAAALLAVILLTAVAAAAWWLESDRQLRETRAATRAAVLVRSLRTTDTAHVPPVLEELAGYRRRADAAIRQLLEESAPASRERLHASLALLPSDSDQVPFLTQRLLAASPEELLVVRDALRPHRDEVAPLLWPLLGDPAEDAGRRLRSACALAAYAPDDPRWGEVAGAVTTPLLADLPITAAGWAQALEPVRDVLIPPLRVHYRDRSQPEARRVLAAQLLAGYAADRPAVLTDLLLDAEPSQFASVLARLRRHRDTAVALLKPVAAREPMPAWEADPDAGAWPAPGADLVRQIAGAGGMVTEHFALCQSLPLGEFDALAGELARCGYRPTCFRPDLRGGTVRVAAIWARAGGATHHAHGLTAAGARAEDEKQRGRGLLPLDVAGYRTPEGDRFAVVWGPSDDVADARLLVGLAEPQHAAAWPGLRDQGLMPRTYQRHVGGDGVLRNNQVWYRPKAGTGAWQFRNGPPALHDEQLRGYPDLLQTDVGLVRHVGHDREARQELGSWLAAAPGTGPAGLPWVALWRRSREPTTEHPERSYTGVWAGRPGWESVEARGDYPREHLARCRELADRGYHPASLAVAEVIPGRPPVAVSVWHRLAMPESARDEFGRRQANAAAALLHLQAADPAWPLFKHGPDPTTRSYLIHRLAAVGLGPQVLLRRLETEDDESARRALLLALGEYPRPEVASLLPRLLAEYRTNPDPGTHSALDWLLRQRWGQADRLRAADAELAGRPPGARRWYVNRHGDTLAVVPGPVEFTMGEPGGGMQRRQVGRSFALATREVTVEQFRAFVKDAGIRTWSASSYSPAPDGPAVSVSWYQAAAYCRWLSEKEGIPPEQMCYPELSKFASGMALAPGLLGRTGYRLPTEAEWEYAARAGAATGRFYGCADELLGRYAWYLHNAEDHARPVGRLKPNDLGLFDVLGNAREWCQTAAEERIESGAVVADRESVGRVADDLGMVLRGGAFADFTDTLRCPLRNLRKASERNVTLGLRVARTMPAD
jgi:formylglycine-generating enzyme required for sulfatase activity/tRNA A-37 threonylcarbamoyl transferase component Bud32